MEKNIIFLITFLCFCPIIFGLTDLYKRGPKTKIGKK